MKPIKIALITTFLLSAIVANAQIKFVQDLSFHALKEKAKVENKLIFMDIMATWCLPCKEMEHVFSAPEAGTFFNEHFLSVRVQMDKTAKDNEAIKAWYADAEKFTNIYKIAGYPTFLFLSPDGAVLNKAVGYMSLQALTESARKSLGNPKKIYESLTRKYDNGDRDTTLIKNLFQMAWFEFQDSTRVSRIANDFAESLDESSFSETTKSELLGFMISASKSADRGFRFEGWNKKLQVFKNSYYSKSNSPEFIMNLARITILSGDTTFSNIVADKYIKSLSPSNIYKKNNLEFINDFTRKSTDMGFNFFRENTDKVNKLTRPHYAQEKITDILFFENLASDFNDKSRKSVPNWEAMEGKVASYGRFGKELVMKLKVLEYYNRQDNKTLFPIALEYFKTYKDFSNLFVLNNIAYDIFKFSDDPILLKEALKWSEIVKNAKEVPYTSKANRIDTYANLLYKLGNKESAILWQSQAVELEPENLEFKENLEKMKKGLKTWLLKTNP